MKCQDKFDDRIDHFKCPPPLKEKIEIYLKQNVSFNYSYYSDLRVEVPTIRILCPDPKDASM